MKSRVRILTQVTTGTTHTCALLDDASVKCWGFGVLGRLGNGGTAIVGDQPGEMGDNLLAVNLGTGVQPFKFLLEEITLVHCSMMRVSSAGETDRMVD